MHHLLLTNAHTFRKLVHAIYRDFFSCKKLKFHQNNHDIFFTFAQNIHCGYTLEPPCRDRSNEYQQCMFLIKNKKKKTGIHLPTPVLLYKSGV